MVYQGGHVSFGATFDPVPLNETGGFAVDCQTWGMTKRVRREEREEVGKGDGRV